MASMIFASSPLSAQSFVKLRTNSNYSHSPCYISRAKNSYIHLPYNNISHIDSSKSLFLKGDSNFSFSSPKFPRVASTNSPSLNIIKACTDNENIYDFPARDVGIGKDIELGDRYKGKVLLIVNLSQQIADLSSVKVKEEMKYLNDLYREYKDKSSCSVKGFEVIGFFPYTEEKGNPKLADFEEEIYELANFPIYRKVYADDDNNKDNLWSFLKRKTDATDQEAFDKFLVDSTGKPVQYFPHFDGETQTPREEEDGGAPHGMVRPNSLPDPSSNVKDAIDDCFSKS